MMPNGSIFKTCLPSFFFTLALILPISRASVSEQCQAELNTFLNNPALAFSSDSTCDYDTSGKVWCTFDYANITADFENACRQTGGKPYQDDFTCSFRQDVGGATAKVDNYYKSYPFCAGTSCSDTEIRELFANTVTTEVEQSLPSFECGVSASIQNGATRIWYFAVMAVSLITIRISYV
jgi:hypothetical protein